MSMWQDGLLFADDFLYVKLMTEKSEKKMLFVKSTPIRDKIAISCM